MRIVDVIEPFRLPIPSLHSSAAAQRLREREEAIIEAYASAARSELEAARTVDRNGLVDTLPELLDNLADALPQGESVANLQESARIGMKHGQIRAHQQAYSLNAVLIEYRLLSRVIFTALRQGGPSGSPDRGHHPGRHSSRNRELRE